MSAVKGPRGPPALPCPGLCHTGVPLQEEVLALPETVEARVALVLDGTRPAGRWREERSREGRKGRKGAEAGSIPSLA